MTVVSGSAEEPHVLEEFVKQRLPALIQAQSITAAQARETLGVIGLMVTSFRPDAQLSEGFRTARAEVLERCGREMASSGNDVLSDHAQAQRHLFDFLRHLFSSNPALAMFSEMLGQRGSQLAAHLADGYEKILRSKPTEHVPIEQADSLWGKDEGER